MVDSCLRLHLFDPVTVDLHSPRMKYLHFLIIPLITACATEPTAQPPPSLVPGEASAPSQITPRESMAIAQQLSTHPWRPFSQNILHGKDKKGVVVQTPDISHEPGQSRKGWWVPGEVNIGVPYKWGGFDDLASFDAAIANGLAGGDVSSPEKRRADNVAVSTRAAGVDCSGFVSRCLKLPSVHDTTQLPAICTELRSPQDLRPGDLLNISHRHVVLCAGWANPEHTWIYYYETGGSPDYWKPALKRAPLDGMLALGYKPLRYRGMAREALPPGRDSKDVLTRGVKSTAVAVPNPTVGEP